MHEQVPHQYTTIQPGLETGNQKSYDFNRIGLGYGERSDFTNSKMGKSVPGAKYNYHESNSISALSKKNNPKTMNGFYNKYDKWEKTCY